MGAQLMPVPILRFLDTNGNPLVGGLLYSYAAGTSTPLATYTDQTAGTTNSNPIVLDSNGQCEVWLGPLAYKFVLKNSASVVQWTVDQVNIINPSSLSISMFPNGLFTADSPGRAPFAGGFITTAMCDTSGPMLANSSGGRALMAPGYLSVDTLGRALMANGYFTADATGQSKFAPGFLSATTQGQALMASGFLLQSHRAALGQQVSSSCGSYSMFSATPAAVTNLSVTITTTGRVVTVALIPDGSASDTGIEVTGESFGSLATYGIGNISFYRGSTQILNQNYTSEVQVVCTSSGGITTTASAQTLYQIPACSFHTYDVPAAGTYTYTVKANVSNAVDQIKITNLKLIAFEN